jgi:type I restriction enzyme M protein
MVPFTEISDQKNDYSLNLPRYIDSTEPEDIHDIEGHLRGGIPNRDIDALQRYWEIISGVRSELFKNDSTVAASRSSRFSERKSVA